MSDVWIGLCEQGRRDELRRVLATIDPEAILTFAQSAIELRERVQQAFPRVGAIVGETAGEMASINIAAALVRDAMANDVVLVVRNCNDAVRNCAAQAGIQHLVDLSTLSGGQDEDLDEPPMAGEEMPTFFTCKDEPSLALGYHAPADEPRYQSLSASRARRGTLDAVLPLVEVPAAQGLVPMQGVAAYRDAACEDPDYVHAYDRYTGTSAHEVLDPSDPAASSQERDAYGEGLSKTSEDGSLGQDGKEAVRGVTSAKKGPIISCVSGRGGVGKTALVAMMAAIAASWDLKVAVLDLDLSYGNLYSCFGLPGPAGLSALAKADEIGDETVLSCGSKAARHIELFGPCELPEQAEAISVLTNQILDVLSRTHDLVLVDTATACTDSLAQAMQASDRLVLVVDERPGAAAAQARMGSFAVRLGVARTRIVRLANRCGAHGKGEPNINRADVGLETARPLRVLDGGMEVVDCLAEGKVDELLELKTRFSESVATCLAKLLSELGSLPDREDARRALEQKTERHRWSFGLRREAV